MNVSAAAELARRFGLAPTPDCVLRLTELVSRQDADLDQLAKVISGDPDLTVRLLRAANPRAQDEADYGVTTVEGALMRNGLGSVLLLAMSAPLVLAVIKTFQTMLSLQLEQVPQKLVRPILEEHVLGTIRFTGKAVGGVHLRLPIDASREIAALLLGLPSQELTDPAVIHDAIGEIANIIGGNLKSNLCDAGLACTLAAPRISRTTDSQIQAVPGGSLERMAFRAPGFLVYVDLSVNPWNE
jgi:chemotaxis protein CheX